MTQNIKSIFETLVQLLVIYLIVAFLIVSWNNNYMYHSKNKAFSSFMNDYTKFVVSQPNKAKNGIKKLWQTTLSK